MVEPVSQGMEDSPQAAPEVGAKGSPLELYPQGWPGAAGHLNFQ